MQRPGDDKFLLRVGQAGHHDRTAAPGHGIGRFHRRCGARQQIRGGPVILLQCFEMIGHRLKENRSVFQFQAGR